ncbi:hypothetical protein [Mycobacterium sp. 236(2023)]|uniref:hypothetical protein n=1 Tax=Mycobacterium sp. 236(2023) TaxID=3038163 RepID=UPI002414DB55|nr:hypothetical protein [Mycobacterium sp. 236(2023)]MDG4667820.1 hypothetical protein [Mycobacterium sp. 236(2023)]
MIPETLGHRVEFSDGYVAPIIAWSVNGRPMIVADGELTEVDSELYWGSALDWRVLPPSGQLYEIRDTYLALAPDTP